jgi:hypothetical protein
MSQVGTPLASADKTVGKSDQRNLRVCARRVSHQAKAVPSGICGHPRGQVPVLPSQCSDALLTPLEHLSWPCGRKTTRWCRRDRTWRCREALAATSGSWMALGHGHPAYVPRASAWTTWERQKWGSHQRVMRKWSLYPHCLCYASRAIRELRCSCSVVSQSHARRRRKVSLWMTCCPPRARLRNANG